MHDRQSNISCSARHLQLLVKDDLGISFPCIYSADNAQVPMFVEIWLFPSCSKDEGYCIALWRCRIVFPAGPRPLLVRLTTTDARTGHECSIILQVDDSSRSCSGVTICSSSRCFTHVVTRRSDNDMHSDLQTTLDYSALHPRIGILRGAE